MDDTDLTAEQALQALKEEFAHHDRALHVAAARALVLQAERDRIRAQPITVLDHENLYERNKRLGEIAQELAKMGL